MLLSPHARTAPASPSSARGGSLDFIPQAEALRLNGHLAQALDVCQRGLAASPVTVAGRLLLTRILVDMGKYESAQSECEAVLEQAPQSMCARRLLVKIALRRHQYARVIALVDELRAETGDDSELADAQERAHRGLAQRGPKPSAGSTDPPPTRAAVLRELSDRPEVLECKVIAVGDNGTAWGDMLRAWREASARSGLGSIHRAFLESPGGTVLIHPLESDQATLMIRVKPGAALNPVKRLIHRILRLDGDSAQGTSEEVAQGGQDER